MPYVCSVQSRLNEKKKETITLFVIAVLPIFILFLLCYVDTVLYCSLIHCWCPLQWKKKLIYNKLGLYAINVLPLFYYKHYKKYSEVSILSSQDFAFI